MEVVEFTASYLFMFKNLYVCVIQTYDKISKMNIRLEIDDTRVLLSDLLRWCSSCSFCWVLRLHWTTSPFLYPFSCPSCLPAKIISTAQEWELQPWEKDKQQREWPKTCRWWWCTQQSRVPNTYPSWYQTPRSWSQQSAPSRYRRTPWPGARRSDGREWTL